MFTQRTFATGHIIFTYRDTDTYESKVIFGVSRRSELSAIGGRSECGETLMSTLIREYVEETHESIVSLSELVRLIEDARVSVEGRSMTLLIDLGSFDFERARSQFRAHSNRLARRDVPRSRRELTDLVSVQLKDVLDYISGKPSSLAIRSAAVSALKSLFLDQ